MVSDARPSNVINPEVGVGAGTTAIAVAHLVAGVHYQRLSPGFDAPPNPGSESGSGLSLRVDSLAGCNAICEGASGPLGWPLVVCDAASRVELVVIESDSE